MRVQRNAVVLDESGLIYMPTETLMSVYDVRILIRGAGSGAIDVGLLAKIRQNTLDARAVVQVIQRTDYSLVAVRVPERDLDHVLKSVIYGIRQAFEDTSSGSPDQSPAGSVPHPLQLHGKIAFNEPPSWSELAATTVLNDCDTNTGLAQLTLIAQGPKRPWAAGVLEKLDVSVGAAQDRPHTVVAGRSAVQRIEIPGNRSTFVFSTPVPGRTTGAPLGVLAAQQFGTGGAGSLLYEELVIRRQIAYSLVNAPLHGRGGGLNLTSFSVNAEHEDSALEGLLRATRPLSAADSPSIFASFRRWLNLGDAVPGVLVDLVANLVASTADPAAIGARVREIDEFNVTDVLDHITSETSDLQHLTVFSGSESGPK